MRLFDCTMYLVPDTTSPSDVKLSCCYGYFKKLTPAMHKVLAVTVDMARRNSLHRAVHGLTDHSL